MYLLDTDTCIDILRHKEPTLAHLLATPRSHVHVSVITEGELRTGAARSARPVRNREAVERFLAPLAVLEFTSDDAVAYAGIRTTLERSGRAIGPLDTLIAAHAVARGLTIVTGNRREFERVPGLSLETWQ